MRSEEQHPFASGESPLEVFESLIYDCFADVLAGVLGKQTDFRDLAAERGKYAAKNLAALVGSFFGKRQRQISFADAPQFSVHQVKQPGNRNASGTGQWPRQHADKLQEDPCQRVFESITQGR